MVNSVTNFGRSGLYDWVIQRLSAVILAIYTLFLFGFAKNALMPLHSWLPAAMVAPTPVSALLHAGAVVKTGVFSTLRVFLFVFGAQSMHALGADNLALIVALPFATGTSMPFSTLTIPSSLLLNSTPSSNWE